MRRLPSLLTVLCLLAGAVLGVPAVSAAGPATASPRVTLHNDRPAISATAHAKFSYHAYDLRAGSQVRLQVQQGAHWTTLARTAKRSGTFTGSFTVGGPGELGAYRFRALVSRKGHVVTTSATRGLHAYGAVSLKALCHGVLDGYCVNGTRTLDDGSTFHYVLATGVNEPSDPWSAMIGAARTSCRLLGLRYISDSQDQTHTYLELRQPGHRTQKHTSSSAVVGSFQATLSGGRFGMSVEQDAAQVFMYFNGKASCWTATGAR